MFAAIRNLFTKNSVTPTPNPVCKGITFWPIPESPKFFNRHDLPYVPQCYIDEVMKLFYDGGKLNGLAVNVDRKLAYSCMYKMLSSFDPPHESKMATAGYALWVWSTPQVTKE